jgi:hypothetical protein
MGDGGVLPESVAGGFSFTQSESSGVTRTRYCSRLRPIAHCAALRSIARRMGLLWGTAMRIFTSADADWQ